MKNAPINSKANGMKRSISVFVSSIKVIALAF